VYVAFSSSQVWQRYASPTLITSGTNFGEHSTGVQAELDKGGDVNAKDGWEWTPLHQAAIGGYREIVELLIAKGADVNAKERYIGSTPLHFAAANRRNELVELLIAKGADVNTKNKNGDTPLDTTKAFQLDSPEVKAARKETADLLRKHGGKTGDWLNADKSIHIAARAGHIEAVKQHIDAGADVNAKNNYGKTPLDLAFGETADFLRKHGGKHSTINTAATAGDAEAVKEFLAAGADVNAKDDNGWTPLHYAAGNGHKEVAELLIAKDADVNAKTDIGRTPLHAAAYSGHKEIAELLIANGADVNAKRAGGVTPLYAATLGAHKEVVELLIAKGADVNAKTDWGSTPLHYAAFGHKEIVELLIAEGADVNAKADGGSTPLQAAASEGQKESAELLIDKGADVNAKNEWEDTPLHTAAYYGHKVVVELLIAKGADLNARNKGGFTPLDSAKDVSSLHSPEDKAAKIEIADLLRKLALMPRLTWNSRGLDGFSFTAKDGMTYVVEVTQDFKQWGELETIEGTGKQVKFIDPRQPLVPFKRNFYRVKVVE
jgi:cytohesin